MSREPTDSGVHFAAVRRAARVGQRPRALRVAAITIALGLGLGLAPLLSRRAPEDPPPLSSRWLRVPGGTFVMGSPDDEVGRFDDETLHEVTLTRSFLLLSTEVTQGDFARRMGRSPSYFEDCGAGCPAERVSWHDAAAYCNALSAEAGLDECYLCRGEGSAAECVPRTVEHRTPYDCPGYRLPTEAEWERAASLGGRGPTPRGALAEDQLECEAQHRVLAGIAWFCGNSRARPHAAGALAGSGAGHHDLLGNVWEWVHDGYGPLGAEAAVDPVATGRGPRVVRGCGWLSFARECRAARRSRQPPEGRFGDVGFRPARTLAP